MFMSFGFAFTDKKNQIENTKIDIPRSVEMMRLSFVDILRRKADQVVKISIMQPYFFPYLGYWQMYSAVDKFVILDDVNYIKKGYINSNSILIQGRASKFTIPLEKASQNKLINESKLVDDTSWKKQLLKKIELAYKKSSFFEEFFPLFREIVQYDETDLVKYLKNSFEKVSKYLGLNTEILLSSEIEKDNSLKAEERIIEICKRLNTDVYINAIGGRKLYDGEHFSQNRISLKFIKMGEYEYRQYSNPFVPNLSFIDVLFFNDKAAVKKLLENYELI